MVALQREILDERRERFINSAQSTGTNSFGPLGLCPGLTMSGVPWNRTVALPPELPNVWDLSGREFHIEGVMGMHASSHAEAPPKIQGFRERELEWRRTHTATLKQFENQWVVLEGEEMVAHGSDPVQVIQEAKEKGIRKPYIFFVEQKRENVITIGL